MQSRVLEDGGRKTKRGSMQKAKRSVHRSQEKKVRVPEKDLLEGHRSPWRPLKLVKKRVIGGRGSLARSAARNCCSYAISFAALATVPMMRAGEDS